MNAVGEEQLVFEGAPNAGQELQSFHGLQGDHGPGCAAGDPSHPFELAGLEVPGGQRIDFVGKTQKARPAVPYLPKRFFTRGRSRISEEKPLAAALNA